MCAARLRHRHTLEWSALGARPPRRCPLHPELQTAQGPALQDNRAKSAITQANVSRLLMSLDTAVRLWIRMPRPVTHRGMAPMLWKLQHRQGVRRTRRTRIDMPSLGQLHQPPPSKRPTALPDERSRQEVVLKPCANGGNHSGEVARLRPRQRRRQRERKRSLQTCTGQLLCLGHSA